MQLGKQRRDLRNEACFDKNRGTRNKLFAGQVRRGTTNKQRHTSCCVYKIDSLKSFLCVFLVINIRT